MVILIWLVSLILFVFGDSVVMTSDGVKVSCTATNCDDEVLQWGFITWIAAFFFVFGNKWHIEAGLLRDLEARLDAGGSLCMPPSF